MDNNCGCVHIYSGDGKGKTTAAVGLAARMAGHGKSVLFCQLLKGVPSGELAPLEALGVRVWRPEFDGMEKFVFQMSDSEKARAAHAYGQCFEAACREVADGAIHLLVLDEILDAVALDMVSPAALLAFLQNRPQGLEVICTGRSPDEGLCALADYHTDFRAVKHPYDKGLAARPGIEY